MIGHTLAHYEILDKVGEGGMGVVYRARDTRLGREVALKFLPPEFSASAELKERFNKEAQTASALDHPNICTIHAMEEADDGRLFIAMAYYEGETLKSRLKRGPLPVSEIADLGLQIATGLAAAHERGIVHMDIKPANLMITREGTVKILDFGLSKFTTQFSEQSRQAPFVDSKSSEKSRTTLMGTVAYMSPERIQGKSVGPENDIWSLGVVLYEMATGRRPFLGASDMSVLYAIVHSDFVAPIQQVAKIPVELDKIVRRALVKDKRYRYRDMAELAADLDNLQQLSHTLTGVTFLGRPRWNYGHSRRFFLPIALAFLMLAFLGWVWWSQSDSRRPGVPPVVEKPVPGALLMGFRNVTGRADSEWVGIALSELLRIEIQEHPDWQWKEPAEIDGDLPTSGFDQQGFPDPTLARIEKESGAEAVVGGSYRSRAPAPGIEVTLLVQSTEGEILGRLQAEGSREDLPALASALVSGLAAALEVEARKWPPSAEPVPLDPVAGDLFAQAREELLLMNALQAQQLLQRAREIEAHSPELQIALSETHEMLGGSEEATRHVRAAADEARRLPREEQLFYIARRRIVEGESEPGAAALLLALWISEAESQLRFERGIYLVRLLAEVGQLETALSGAALEVLEQLRAADPENPRVDLAAAQVARYQVNFKETLEAVQRFLELTVDRDVPFLLAEAYTIEGDAHIQLNQFEEARRALEKARKIYNAQGHQQGEANTHLLLGNAHYGERSLLDAKASYESAAQIYGAIGNRTMQARILGNKGLVVRDRGDLEAAIDVFRQALDLLRDIGDMGGEAMALTNVAETEAVLGNFDRADKTYERAFALIAEVENQSIEAGALLSWGEYLILRGDLLDAGREFSKALRIQELSGDQLNYAETLAAQARVFFYQGDLEMARQKQEEALEIFDGSDKPPLVPHLSVLQGLGETLLASGDPEAARTYFERALTIPDQASVEPHLVADLLLSLADVLIELGEPREAERKAQDALDLLAQEQAVLTAARIHGGLARSLLAQGEIEQAALEVQRGEELLGSITSPIYRVPLEITAARVLAARIEAEEAREILNRIVADSTTAGLGGFELEARLALGEIDLANAEETTGRRGLGEVEREARLKGFGLIAEKARRAIGEL